MGIIAGVVTVILVLVFAGIGFKTMWEDFKEVVFGDESEDDEKDDHKKREIFTESTDITVYDVKKQLSPIGELATYKMTYDGHEKIEDYAQVKILVRRSRLSGLERAGLPVK